MCLTVNIVHLRRAREEGDPEVVINGLLGTHNFAATRCKPEIAYSASLLGSGEAGQVPRQQYSGYPAPYLGQGSGGSLLGGTITLSTAVDRDLGGAAVCS